MNNTRFTHLDLCSGIGGFALAARWTGWHTIGFSEIDEFCCKVLEKNFPGIPNYGDIRGVRGISATLVTAGFPCQPVSLAGRRNGATDDRWLWPEVARVVADARPRFFLGENVSGLISLGLDDVLADLESIGYATQAFVIPACAVDAPHRRERVWIVAHTTQFAKREPADKTFAIPVGRHTWDEPGCGGQSIPGAHGEPLGRAAIAREERSTGEFECGLDRVTDGLPRGMDGYRWKPESAIPRVIAGQKDRASRLKALGNAIVPQVAAVIMGCMLNIINQRETMQC